MFVSSCSSTLYPESFYLLPDPHGWEMQIMKDLLSVHAVLSCFYSLIHASTSLVEMTA